jgi:NSS family neurotransmitter:Na+ symporter
MAHEQGVAVSELSGLKGVSLAFVTFPKAISQMPAAWLFGALFFASLLMAGFTSMISIVEVISAGFQDKFGWTRRKAALILGLPSACVSLALFGTTTGQYALDVVDHFANNFGIVISAIAMMIVTLWVLRKGRELSYHLSALSTFKVGRTWRALATWVGPVVLGYMLVKWVMEIMSNGYESYPTWYLLTFGWGAVLVMVAGAFIFKALAWRSDPDDFTPWPDYPPVPAKEV